jgi:glycogen debranching enzyme
MKPASLVIPLVPPHQSNGPDSLPPATPKTPADEGIEFFQSPIGKGEAAIQVYELNLEPDGGPDKDRSVRFHVEISG